jgi:hypothetical protein
MKTPFQAMVAALAVLALSSSLEAQSQSQDDENRMRADCRLAQQVIATGNPAPQTGWAYGIIGACGHGAQTLADRWTSAPDGAALTQLMVESARLNDRRILTAMLPLIGDASRPLAVRRAAMYVAIQLHSPELIMTDDLWRNPAGAGLFRRSHFFQRAGEQPLTASDRSAILAAFTQLAQADPDATIRAVAKSIARDLTP